MLIEYNGGNKVCNNHEDVIATLKMRNKENENEFWVSIDAKFPCMAILVKNKISSVTYFPDEESAGFRAIKATMEDETAYLLIGGHQYEIESGAIIPFEEVISAVLRFYDSHTLPDNLKWDEL